MLRMTGEQKNSYLVIFQRDTGTRMLTTLHKVCLDFKNKLRYLIGKNQTFSKPGHHQGDDDLVSKMFAFYIF